MSPLEQGIVSALDRILVAPVHPEDIEEPEQLARLPRQLPKVRKSQSLTWQTRGGIPSASTEPSTPPSGEPPKEPTVNWDFPALEKQLAEKQEQEKATRPWWVDLPEKELQDILAVRAEERKRRAKESLHGFIEERIIRPLYERAPYFLKEDIRLTSGLVTGLLPGEEPPIQTLTTAGKIQTLAGAVAFSLPWGTILTRSGRAVLGATAKDAANSAFKQALNTGLDRWIATKGRMIPGMRGRLADLIIGDRVWLQERATENMLRRMGRTPNSATAARQAAQDTVGNVEQRIGALIPRGSQTAAMTMGGLPKKPVTPAPEVTKSIITKATQYSIDKVENALRIIENLAPKEIARESVGRRRQLVNAYESLDLHAKRLGIITPKLGTYYNPQEYLTNARQMSEGVNKRYKVTAIPEAVAVLEKVTPALEKVAIPEAVAVPETKPTIPPAEPPIPEVGTIPPAKPPGGGAETQLTDFLPTAELLEALKTEVLPEKLLKFPGIRQLVGLIAQAKTANHPIKAIRVIRGGMEDTTGAAVMGATQKALKLKPPVKQRGEVVIDPRIKQIEKLPGEKESMAFHDIVEYSSRYDMPPEVRAYVDEIRHVAKQATALMKKHKVPIRQKVGEEDWAFLHRVALTEKEDITRDLAYLIEQALAKQGQVLSRSSEENAWAYLQRFMGGITKGTIKAEGELAKLTDDVVKIVDVDLLKQRLDKPRIYALTADGMKAGVKYEADPWKELVSQLRLAYQAIIKKEIGNALKPFTATRAELLLPIDKRQLYREAIATRDLVRDQIRSAVGLEAQELKAVWREAASKVRELEPEVLQMVIKAQNRVKVAKAASRILNEARYWGRKVPQQRINQLEKVEFYVPNLSERVLEAMKLRKPQRLNVLKSLQSDVKDEIIKAQTNLNGVRLEKAKALETVPTAEMGQVIGMPGISGRIIPTQFINGVKYTGRDLARAITAELGYQPPTAIKKIARAAGAVGSVFLLGRLSLDLSLSAVTTQLVLGMDMYNFFAFAPRLALKELGLFGYAKRPTYAWFKGTAEMMRITFNRQLRHEANYWTKAVNQENLRWAAPRQTLFQPFEFVEAAGPVMGKLAKIPVIGKGLSFVFKHTYGRAAAAWTGGTNIMANEWTKAYRPMAEAGGIKAEREILKFSNLIRGVLSTRGMGISDTQRSLESAFVFLAPRYTRATWDYFSWLFRGGMKSKLAWQSLVGWFTAVNIFFAMTALSLGQRPKLDPRPKSMGGDGSDYLSILVGGKKYSLGGGIMGAIKLAANTLDKAMDDPEAFVHFDMENPLVRYYRGRSAAITSISWDYITRRNYIGEPTKPWEIGKWGLPIWVEGAVAEGASLPSIITEFFGGNTYPESNWSIYERRLLGLSGKSKVDEISDFDKARLEREYPELAELKELAIGDMKRRGYNPLASEFWDRRSKLQADRVKQLKMAEELFVAGSITNVDLRKKIQDSGLVLGGQYKVIDEDPKYAEILAELKKDVPTFVEDKAYLEYYGILFDPSNYNEMGEPKYDVIRVKENDLRAKYPDDVWEKVEERIRWSREVYPLLTQEYMEDRDLLAIYWQDIRLGEPDELSTSQKVAYRRTHPEIDVALNVWGYTSTVKSFKALQLLKERADELALPHKLLPALKKTTMKAIPQIEAQPRR